MPKVVQQLLQSILPVVRLSDPAVRQSMPKQVLTLQEHIKEPFGDFLLKMMPEALELNVFCNKSDGKAYDQNLEKLQRLLRNVRSVKKEWPPLLKWAELDVLAESIDFFKCEVFPTERADAMSKIVATYAEVHSVQKRLRTC